MCEAVFTDLKNGALSIWSDISEFAKVGGGLVSSPYNYLGSRVEQLANDNLPPTAAKIVSSFAWSSPYTAISALLPGLAFEIVSGAVLSIRQRCPHDLEEMIGQKNREHLYSGLRNGFVIHVVKDIVQLALTRRWMLLIPIIFNLFGAIQSHFIATGPLPEKKEESEVLAPMAPVT